MFTLESHKKEIFCLNNNLLPKYTLYIYIYIYIYIDLGSIPGQVIPKTQKWYLMPPCLTLSIIRYGSRVKWSNPEKEVAPSPTPWCSNYRKGSLRITLDYGRQLYFIYIYIYIYICVCMCVCVCVCVCA